MAKNLIPEIAKMLGVEIGEEFKVKGDDELTYRFDSDGLKLTHDSGIELAPISANVVFVALVKGEEEIIKLLRKPKKGESYYTFGTSAGTWIVWQQRWANHPVDLALFGKGWVYRTRAEAEAALPAVAAEIGAEYEI